MAPGLEAYGSLRMLNPIFSNTMNYADRLVQRDKHVAIFTFHYTLELLFLTRLHTSLNLSLYREGPVLVLFLVSSSRSLGHSE